MRGFVAIVATTVGLAAWGCLPFGGGRPQSAELTAVARELGRVAQGSGATIDWIGLRDGGGDRSEAIGP